MRPIRSIFVSDLHLGCKYANAAALLSFLKEQQPRYLYLVGDIIDGWRLRRGWYWDDSYSFLIRRVLGMLKTGTIVRYTPGNHDEFLRHFIDSLGSVQIADEFIHHTADGQRVLVTHGDQFDSVVRHARWLSLLGDVGYNALLALNRWFNLARRCCGFGYWSLSSAIKRQVKSATNFISDFEEVVTRHAASKGCDAVLCGHIHTPIISQRNGVRYLNCGDWVESCTAIVEYTDGTFELIHRPSHRDELMPAASDTGFFGESTPFAETWAQDLCEPEGVSPRTTIVGNLSGA
jgi:UDP-2,3-diacylglucosamine pyrophosphatase LpxH